MADKLLQESDWKKFIKGRDVDDAALVKALAAAEKAEKAGGAAWQDALSALDKQLAAFTKACKLAKTDKELAARLDGMDKALETERKAAEAAAAASDDDESPDALTGKMVPLLRQVRKGDTAQAMVVLAGKDTALMLSRKAIAATKRKMLVEYLKASGSIKTVMAQCIFEKEAHTFVIQEAAAGMAKRLKGALLAQTGMKLKVRVRGLDPNDVDEDLEGEDAEMAEFAAGLRATADETAQMLSKVADETAARMKAAAEETAAAMARALQTPEQRKAEEEAQKTRQAEEEAQRKREAEEALAKRLAALEKRRETLRADLERGKVEKTPIAADVAKRLETLGQQMLARDADGAEKSLAQLEQLAKAVLAKAAGGQGAAQAAAKAADLKQHATRLLAVRGELERLEASKTPIGPDVAQRLEEVTKKLQAKDPEGVAKMLDQLDQIAKAIAARRGAAPKAAEMGQARIDDQEGEEAYQQAWQALADRVQDAEDLIGGAEERLFTEDIDALRDALRDRDEAVDERRWNDAIGLLGAVEAAADELLRVKGLMEAYDQREQELEALLDEAGDIAGNDQAAALGDVVQAFEDAKQALDDAKDSGYWDDALDALNACGVRAEELVEAARQAGEMARFLMDNQSTLERAMELVDDTPEHFPAELVAGCKKASDDFKAAGDDHRWADALDQARKLLAVCEEVLACETRHEAYVDQVGADADANNAVLNVIASGARFPDDSTAARDEARSKRDKAAAAADWTAALEAQRQYTAESAKLQKIIEEGDAYYAAHKALGPVMSEAYSAQFNRADRLALLVQAYRAINKDIGKDVDAKNWSAARGRLPELEKAAKALAEAAKTYKGQQEPFEKEWAKLTGLAQARQTFERPPQGLAAAALENFGKAYLPANDARNAGEFDRALPMLPELQKAIDALNAAREEWTKAREKIAQAIAKIPQLAEARDLLEANPTALVTQLMPMRNAEEALALAQSEGKWDAAAAQVTALGEAVKAVMAERGRVNTAAKPEDFVKLQERLDAFKERVGTALAEAELPFLKSLQNPVRNASQAAQAAITRKDRIAAETALAALEPALASIEKARTDHAEHLRKLKAAIDGDVKTARATKLQSPTLHQMRDKALDAQIRRIETLASAGSFSAADAAVAALVDQAKAWVKSKAAYLELYKGATRPDAAKLSELTKLPGGGEVLDALIAELPEDKPQTFMKEALKARYGFEVKQFKKKDPDRVTRLTGLTAVDETLPDKSLKALYGMLGEVPLEHIQGNVKELVRFTEETGGAAYGNNKVYMYCGRADDPKASQQQFLQAGEIVPEGEAVNPDCQPVDTTPVQYFKFAAMHEVGHAEDAASGYMGQTAFKAYAGWRTHGAAEIADIAASHFKFDKAYLQAMLDSEQSTPPTTVPPPTDGIAPEAWEDARKKAEAWVRGIRVGAALWNHASRSKQHAIGGRVYHEAYAGDWVSYEFAARAQGITGYQFRAPGEWFAELYAAYYCKKLKPSHPAMDWLAKL